MIDPIEALVRVLVVTDPALLAGRDAMDVCRAAVQGGATAIEVRDKTAGPRDLAALTGSLVRGLSVPVLVNDRLDVALATGAAGCHLGADDFPAAVARDLVPAGFLLGVSVGSPEEAVAVRGVAADYWGIGPCFPTGTKADAGPAIGPDGFARLRALAGAVPCVGIGGITEVTAPGVIAAGAAGVAVSRAVIGAADPRAAARRLRLVVDAALATGL